MSANILEFPKTKIYRSSIPEIKLNIQEPTLIVDEVKPSHHHETFDYNDDSYVVLFLPKDQQFTVDKMVFMAERLKLQLFSLLDECYDDTEGDVDPPQAS